MENLNNYVIFTFIFLLMASLSAHFGLASNDVLQFGARGDGHTDDSKAFLKAWKATCEADNSNAEMVIPEGRTFLLNPLVFKGPCKSTIIKVEIKGIVIAPENPDVWKGLEQSRWIEFNKVDGLQIDGNTGILDGRGQKWWDKSCRYHPGPGCISLAPNILKFIRCNGGSLSHLKLVNSPQTHVLLLNLQRFDISNLIISSPGDTANTDGIHIQIAKHIKIRHTNIQSGDDCISIGDQIQDVKINDIHCGPGHGISIGSLGRKGEEAKVEDVQVWDSHFDGTTNGIRIKTYQEGTGYARGFRFNNLHFKNVQNPIMIDQYYCAVAGRCPPTDTAVAISDITYEGFTGTSITQLAMTLNCSGVIPCSGLTFNNIQLASAKPGQEVSSFCYNAHGHTNGVIKPSLSCLAP